MPRVVESEGGSRENTLERFRTPPRNRSPSVTRIELKPAEIQHMLGNCVNAIVKWHYKPARDRDASTLTKLLCGEGELHGKTRNISNSRGNRGKEVPSTLNHLIDNSRRPRKMSGTGFTLWLQVIPPLQQESLHLGLLSEGKRSV